MINTYSGAMLKYAVFCLFTVLASVASASNPRQIEPADSTSLVQKNEGQTTSEVANEVVDYRDVTKVGSDFIHRHITTFIVSGAVSAAAFIPVHYLFNYRIGYTGRAYRAGRVVALPGAVGKYTVGSLIYIYKKGLVDYFTKLFRAPLSLTAQKILHPFSG